VRGIVEQGPRPDATVWRRDLHHAFAFLLFGGLCASCSIPGTRATDVLTVVQVPPSPVVEAETVVGVKLVDRVGKVFDGAILRVEAHMTHPGMAPVVSQVVDEGKGAYSVRVRFPMAGAWVLRLKGELADRRTIDQQLCEITVRPAG
jgi:hypothetical protein